MEFILVLKICSQLAMYCQPSLTYKEIYKTWKECEVKGLSEAQRIVMSSDEKWLNDYQILVQFACLPKQVTNS